VLSPVAVIPAEIYSYTALSSSAAAAFIGILETLISARLADTMTDTDHDKKRELFGLGVANLVGGGTKPTCLVGEGQRGI